MNTRCIVIYVALQVEYNISNTLAYILDIDLETSKTLANKSTALSFKTKIDILTDIKALDREDAKKFEHFAQIRNQFAHNIEADTMQKCFSYLDGLEKRLLSLYPQVEEADKEIKLITYFFCLCTDLWEAIEKLTRKVASDRGYEAGNAKGQALINESLIEALVELTKDMPNKNNILEDLLERVKVKFEQDKPLPY